MSITNMTPIKLSFKLTATKVFKIPTRTVGIFCVLLKVLSGTLLRAFEDNNYAK